MRPILKYGLLAVLAALLIGGYAGYKMWNKPHREVAHAEADVQLDAAGLYAQFTGDETAANAKYLDKIVLVCGAVAQVSNENNVVTVQLDAGDPMGGILCELDPLSEHKRTDFQPGEKVCFKGICTGYLSDVVLNRCSEVTR